VFNIFQLKYNNKYNKWYVNTNENVSLLTHNNTLSYTTGTD